MRTLAVILLISSAISYSYAKTLRPYVDMALEKSHDFKEFEGRSVGGRSVIFSLETDKPFSGYIRERFESGALKTLYEYEEGIPSGLGLEFYEVGTPKSEIFYDDGKPDGSAYFWDEKEDAGFYEAVYSNGQLLRTLTPIMSNTMDSYFHVKEFYKEGSILREGALLRGERYLGWTEYYESGQKKSEVSYLYGLANGPAAYWDEEGSLTKSTEYRSGEIMLIENPLKPDDEEGDQDSLVPCNLRGKWTNEGIVNTLCHTQIEIEQIGDRFSGVIFHTEYDDPVNNNGKIVFETGVNGLSLYDGIIKGNKANFAVSTSRGGTLGSGELKARGKDLFLILRLNSRAVMTTILHPEESSNSRDLSEKSTPQQVLPAEDVLNNSSPVITSPAVAKKNNSPPPVKTSKKKKQPAVEGSLKPDGMSDVQFLILIFLFIGFWVWIFSRGSKQKASSEAPRVESVNNTREGHSTEKITKGVTKEREESSNEVEPAKIKRDEDKKSSDTLADDSLNKTFNELKKEIYGGTSSETNFNDLNGIATSAKELLGDVVPISVIREGVEKLVNEENRFLPKFLPHDLAVLAALICFSKPDYVNDLRDCRSRARITLLNWLKKKLVSPEIASKFEEEVERLYQPSNSEENQDATASEAESSEEMARRIATVIEGAVRKAEQLFQSYLEVLNSDEGDFMRDENLLPASKKAVEMAILMQTLQAENSPNLNEQMPIFIKAWNTLGFFGRRMEAPGSDQLIILDQRIQSAWNKKAEGKLYLHMDDEWLNLGRENLHRSTQQWAEDNWKEFRGRMESGKSRIECLVFFSDGKLSETEINQLEAMAQ